MGDRTHCTLMIGGKIAETAFAALIDAMTEGAPDEFYGETLAEGLRSTPQVEFHEMNWGTLPDALERAVIAAGLAYHWSWGDGGSYGPGVALYDPTTGERGEYGTLDGEIALRVADTENPDVVRHAERWLKFEREFPALIVIADDAAEGEAAS